MSDARTPAVRARCDAETQRAIDAGVFAAPSCLVDGELFWGRGRDRLDFLQRRPARG